MAGLQMAMEPVRVIRKPKERVAAPEPSTRESAAAIESAAIVRILERAANDPAFIAALTSQGSKALQGYNLSREGKAAVVSGDINWIQAHIGELDERLSTWPRCRLQQEIW